MTTLFDQIFTKGFVESTFGPLGLVDATYEVPTKDGAFNPDTGYVEPVNPFPRSYPVKASPPFDLARAPGVVAGSLPPGAEGSTGWCIVTPPAGVAVESGNVLAYATGARHRIVKVQPYSTGSAVPAMALYLAGGAGEPT